MTKVNFPELTEKHFWEIYNRHQIPQSDTQFLELVAFLRHTADSHALVPIPSGPHYSLLMQGIMALSSELYSCRNGVPSPILRINGYSFDLRDTDLSKLPDGYFDHSLNEEDRK